MKDKKKIFGVKRERKKKAQQLKISFLILFFFNCVSVVD